MFFRLPGPPKAGRSTSSEEWLLLLKVGGEGGGEEEEDHNEGMVELNCLRRTLNNVEQGCRIGYSQERIIHFDLFLSLVLNSVMWRNGKGRGWVRERWGVTGKSLNIFLLELPAETA